MQDGLTIRYKFDFRQAADERRRKAISEARKREWAEEMAKPPEGTTQAARTLAASGHVYTHGKRGKNKTPSSLTSPSLLS